MYKILNSDGAVLYDINDPNTRPVTEAKGTFEIGQPGSLQFSLVPQHPLYDDVAIMETYVNALKESSEIFYGRVIDINVDKITGIKRIECAGALSFLSDGELPPVTDPTDASKGVELTASAFFTRCIEAYNAEIGNDPKRALSIGTISHAKAQETKTYHMTGYTQIKSALESNLINEYGGYFRVRKDGNAHVIDWLDTYTEPNTSPIELRRNIRNQENAIAPGDFFTMIRPSGKNNLVLDPIPVSEELVSRYGRIIKSVSFKEAETEEGLRSDVANYLADLTKGAGKTSTIRLVDLHFLDDSIPTIHMGSTYTNIAGFEGESMVIAGMELNFSNPADDSITAKNAKDLEAGKKGVASSKGSLAKETSGSRGFQNIWQHITETKDELRMAAEKIEINAQNLTEVVGTFERYAEETTETIELQGTKITAMQGTGVLQNSDQITQVAGLFSSKYYLVPVAARTGRNPSTAGWYEATQYLVSENDINSGIELYSSVTAALAGNAINTTNGLTPYIGQWVTRMVSTSDTTPVTGKNYYSKTLGLLNGASFTISDDLVDTNVGVVLKETSEGVGENERQIALIQGSSLWVQRDQITGVTGEYEIVTAADGTKTLVIKSGGGLKIRRNNVEYGIYDEDSLTAGVMVKKINGDQTETHIKGNKIYVGNGASENEQLSTWAADTDGLFATSISALQGRISSLEVNKLSADQITGNFITSRVGAANSMTIGNLTAGDVTSSGVMTAATLKATALTTGTLYMDGVYLSPGNLVQSVVGSSTADGGYKFTVTQADGSSEEYPFDIAASIASFTGTWSGATFTARALDEEDNELGSTSTIIGFNWSSSSLQVKSGTDVLLEEDFTFEAHSGVSNVGGLTTISTFDNNHKAYGLVIAESLGPLRRFAVDATSVYDEGSTAGYNVGVIDGGTAAGLIINETAKTVERSISSETKSLAISARLSAATYNISTHKYDLTIYGRAGSTDMGSITPSTGTEAYDAGSTAGYNAGVADGGTAAGLSINATANTVERSISSATKSLAISARLSAATYNTSTHKYDLTIYGRAGSTDMGSITPSTGTEAYNAGVVDGGTAAGVAINSTAGTVERSTSSTTKSYAITATCSQAYDSSTHKYTATATSKAGSTAMGTATATTGVEAYNDGVTDGGTAAGLSINETAKTVERSISSTTKSYAITATCSQTYDSSTHKYTATATSKAGSTAMGTATATTGVEAYNDGVTDGGTAAGLSINETAKTVERSISSTTKSYAITATCSQAYNSSTHKYTATATSKAGSTSMGTATATTGVEAYNAGVTDGGTAAGLSINGTAKTVERSISSTTKSYAITATCSQAYNSSTHKYTATATSKAGSTSMGTATATTGTEAYDAGYAAGWAAAKAKISLSGAKIMVPPATVDGAAVEGYNITVVQGGISASRITSSNYALSASSSAYINGTAVATDSTSRNLTV